MEKKEIGVKVEDADLCSGYYPFDKSCLGFMELLGVQDYSPLLDLPQVSSFFPHHSKELNQQPATPNSSSISSASSEAVNDEDEQQQKTNKQLKTKKKRQREARFAFMTKSEVDHLEDGYRWRKYGQKAVKNSPFPRSYYRCTSVSCYVKKRVERSFTDPSIVVTTYEGQHTHPSPVVMPRTNFGSLLPPNYLSSQQLFVNTLALPYNDSSSNNTRLCTNAFLRDHGLLQDVVPSHMFKQD